VQDNDSQQVQFWLVITLSVLVVLQTVGLIVSAVILGIALRIIGKQFIDGQRLEVNRCTMSLHIMVLVSFTSTVAFYQLTQLAHFEGVATQNHFWHELEPWSRVVMFLLGALNQIIVVYLFLDFSKTMGLGNA